MRVVVLFPTHLEAAPFEQRVAEGKCVAEVVICGVGMAECGAGVARCVRESAPDMVVLAGVAGSYTPTLQFGDTVTVAEECVADMGRVESWTELDGERFTPLFTKHYSLSDLAEGLVVVCSNTVNGCGVPYARCAEAEIENMEGAAFVATARALNLRCMEVRTISNQVGERFSREDVEQCAEVLADQLCQILNNLN